MHVFSVVLYLMLFLVAKFLSNTSQNQIKKDNDYNNIFAANILNAVHSSRTMSKIFDFKHFSKHDVINAFCEITHNITSYLRLLLSENVVNITVEVIDKAFDPEIYLDIYVKSLANYLQYRKYLLPNPTVVANNFIKHLRKAADSVSDSTDPLSNLQAVVTAMNFFFVEDSMKINEPSFLSAFVNNLLLSKSETGIISPVVPESITDATNLTMFVNAITKNISLTAPLKQFFELPFSQIEIADAFYDVIYDFAVITNQEKPEMTAQAVKSVILMNFNKDTYKHSLLTAIGTENLQRNVYKQLHPKAFEEIVTTRLEQVASNARKALGPKSYVLSMVNAIHNLHTLMHTTIIMRPSFLANFIEELYASKEIPYTFPDLVQYKIDHHLIEQNWLRNRINSDS